MRLIDVETMEITSFAITPDLYKTDILYAILSHTWGEEEVTFQDFYKPGRHLKKGFKKILACCKQANEDGIRWVWVDTCCIDKTNSTELTEAINSMFGWYRLSTVCYVFLEDVPARAPNFPAAKFRKARWFTRGWCLQELLAPPKVEFYAKDWSDIGTKWSLLPLIQEITGIQREALLHERPIWEFSVEERMSWASRRVTTKSEDKAYCLLGIFDVSMPLIYGEGWKAFGRLRRKISKRGHEPPIFSNVEGGCMIPSEREGLEIILSSPVEVGLSLVQTIPPLLFCHPELRAYKKSIPAGPRLWCHGHHSHQLDPVILKLDFDGRDSVCSLIVTFWPGNQGPGGWKWFPRCSIKPYAQPGKLATEELEQRRQSFQDEKANSTDRVDCKVPNTANTATVIIKWGREPGSFNMSSWGFLNFRKPAPLALYATIYDRVLKPQFPSQLTSID